jgi:predicted unusual protein kinase regulating ubiquinone biosynthesis (AarF/ABC1/UbiB family)
MPEGGKIKSVLGPRSTEKRSSVHGPQETADRSSVHGPQETADRSSVHGPRSSKEKVEIDWSTKLQRFQQITKPLKGDALPSAWGSVVVRAAGKKDDGKKEPKKWVFDDVEKGEEILLDYFHENEVGYDSNRVDDYVHVLTHGITASADSIKEKLETRLDELFEDVPDEFKATITRAIDELSEKSVIEVKQFPGMQIFDSAAAMNEFEHNIERLSGASDLEELCYKHEVDDAWPAMDLSNVFNTMMALKDVEHERQKTLERRLDTAIDLLGLLSDWTADLVDDFRIAKVGFHVIADPDLYPFSHSARSLDSAIKADNTPADHIAIGEGAKLDEVLHEMIHSIPQKFLPEMLKVHVDLKKIDLKAKYIDLKVALEEHDNAHEARAFTGMAILREDLKFEGFGLPPWGDYAGLISIAKKEGTSGVYEELISNSEAYRKQGIGNAWKMALFMKSQGIDPEKMKRSYWIREAEGWGIYFSEPGEKSRRRISSIDLDRSIGKILETDSTEALRMMEMSLEDAGLIRGLSNVPASAVFKVLKTTELDSPRTAPLPSGKPGRIKVDPDSTKSRLTLLAKQDQMWRNLSWEDVAHFEGNLLTAERSEGGQALELYKDSQKMVRHQLRHRLYGSSMIMAARLGASLVKAGYTDEGKNYLRSVLHYMLNTERIAEAKGRDYIAYSVSDSAPDILEGLLGDYIAAGMSSEVHKAISRNFDRVTFSFSDRDEDQIINEYPTLIWNQSSIMRMLSRLLLEGDLDEGEKSKVVTQLKKTIDTTDSNAHYGQESFSKIALSSDPWTSRALVESPLSEHISRWDDEMGEPLSFQNDLLPIFLYDEELPSKVVDEVVRRVDEFIRLADDGREKVDVIRYKSKYPTGAASFLEQYLQEYRKHRDRIKDSLYEHRPLEDFKFHYFVGFKDSPFGFKDSPYGERNQKDHIDESRTMELMKVLSVLTLQLREEKRLQERALELLVDLPAGEEDDAFIMSIHSSLTKSSGDVLMRTLMPQISALGPLWDVAREVRGEAYKDHSMYFSYPDARALALVRAARAFPERAGELLSKAEEAMDIVDPIVRFENYPALLVKVNLLTELSHAYLDLTGNIEAADRVHQFLIEDYVEDLEHNTKKQLRTVKEHVSSLSKDDRSLLFELIPALRGVEDAQAGISSVAIGARYEARKALALSNKDKLNELADQIEDDVVQRRKNFGISDIIDIFDAVAKAGKFKEEAARLGAIVIRALAAARGASGEIYGSGLGLGMVKRGRSAVKSVLQEEREKAVGFFRGKGVHSFEDADLVERDEELEIYSTRYRLADGHMKFTSGFGLPQRGLFSAVDDFIASSEDSALSEGEKESMYIDLVDALIPSQSAYLPELAERLPESLEPFEDLTSDGRYPNLARHVLRQLERIAHEMDFDPKRPAQNSSISMVLTQLARKIVASHPELVHPDNLSQLIALSSKHQHFVSLRELFPKQIESALSKVATDRIKGFPYTLGDVLVGNYDRETAREALVNVLNERVIGSEELDGDAKLFFRMSGEMLRQEAGERPESKSIKKSIIDWIENEAPKKLEQSRLDSIARSLLTPGDYKTGEYLKDYALDIISSSASGQPVTPDREILAVDILNSSGLVSNHAYNLYVTDSPSWDSKERERFLGRIIGLAPFVHRSSRTSHDIVWELVDKLTLGGVFSLERFVETYERVLDWVDGKSGLQGSFKNPVELLMYYEQVVAPQDVSFDNYIDLIRRRAQIRTGRGGAGVKHIDVWLEMRKHFDSPARDGVYEDISAFHEMLNSITDIYREAREQVRLTSFRIPRAFRELPPVVRYAVARYFTDLPLGEREDILSDFEGEDMSAEEAFKLFFEKTGNEKLGQFLSMMKGRVPDSYRKVFAQLLDDVKGSSEKEVMRELRVNYGQEPEEVFTEFDLDMVKSGSIGEIYRAMMGDLPVMVKVLVGSRKQKIEQNLGRLAVVAKDIKRHGAHFGLRFDPVDMVEEFDRTIHEEMDFLKEIANAKEYSELLPEGVVTPTYYEDISRPNVLVMSELKGVPFDEVEDVEIKRSAAELLGQMLARHIFVDGFFYDDPHPKNIFVDGATVGLLDFGRLGRLGKTKRGALVNFIMTLFEFDAMKIADAMMPLIKRSEFASRSRLNDLIGKVVEETAPESVVSLADNVFAAAAEARFVIASEYLQAIKALMTMEATAREDDRLSDFNMTGHIMGAIPDAVARLKGGNGGSPAPTVPPSSPTPTTPSSPVTPPQVMSPHVMSPAVYTGVRPPLSMSNVSTSTNVYVSPQLFQAPMGRTFRPAVRM